MAKDKALQEKFKAISKRYAGQKSDEKQLELIYRKELIPMARKAGFDFTDDELKEYTRESQQAATHELSEDELAAVSGGSCTGGTGIFCDTLSGAIANCSNNG